MDTVLLHFLPELPSLFLEELRPVILSRVSDGLADDLELMHFGVALEEGHSDLEKLGNDASDGPHIHCPSIFLHFHEQLRGTVPQRDHLPSERTVRFFCAGKKRSYLSHERGRNRRF